VVWINLLPGIHPFLCSVPPEGVEDKSPDTLAGLCDSDTMRSALVLAGIL
jgi:hypothetical protein